MSTAEDFIQQHAVNGEMTAQQAAQLLELGEGDTGLPEKSDEPEVTTDSEQDPKTEPAESELTAENAVILAKDGKHTISFSKLLEAREGEKNAKSQLEAERQRADAAMQELETLKAQAQQRADAGLKPTAADQNLAVAEAAIEAGVNADLFGDFSEEALAKGVKAIASQEIVKAVQAEVAKALAPMQAEKTATAFDAHLQAIYDKHPDLDSILESQELSDWIKSQPGFARAGFESVLKTGSTAELIEFFDTFKSATGKSQEANTDDVKAAAKAAIAKAQVQVPNSLSDIPGGRVGPASAFEAIANLPPHEQIDAVAQLPPEQRERWLNSQL